MKTPHKHAELIKAWADGAEIEFFLRTENCWRLTKEPSWGEALEYRIKPEPKPDVRYYCNVYKTHAGLLLTDKAEAIYEGRFSSKGLLSLSFDGETGILKSVEIVK